MDFRNHSIIELRAMIRTGVLSASDLVEHSLACINDADSSVHAFAEVLPQQALAAALEISADDPRPLAGIPIAIKANRNVAGARSDSASFAIRDRRSSEDSFLVQQLRSAGMIIIGVTATSEFCLLPSTESTLHGRTLNPRVPGCSAGGSSGGSAAAVARGMVPVAYGNDAAGSLRIPAAWCGLVGLALPADAPEELMAQEGLIANSVDDAFQVARQLGSLTVTDRGLPHASIDRRPIAIAHRSPIGHTGDDHDESALARAGSLLSDMGLHVVDTDPPWGSDLALHMFALMAPRARRRICQELGVPAETAFDDFPLENYTREFLDNAGRVSEHDQRRALEFAEAFRSQINSWAHDYSMVMTTTTIGGPPSLGALSGSLSMREAGPAISRATAFTWWTNVVGWPSVSLPILLDEAGSPRSIQLCAPSQNLQELHEVARQLMRGIPRDSSIGVFS
jgi:amidase